jgi:hypothetical protein
VAAENHLLEAESIQETDHIGGMLGHGVAGDGFVTQTPPAQVEGQYPKARTQPGTHEAIERMGVGGDPGHQHDDWLATRVVQVVQLNVVGLDKSIHGLQPPR